MQLCAHPSNAYLPQIFSTPLEFGPMTSRSRGTWLTFEPGHLPFFKVGPNCSFILPNAQNRSYIYKLLPPQGCKTGSLGAISRCLIHYATTPHPRHLFPVCKWNWNPRANFKMFFIYFHRWWTMTERSNGLLQNGGSRPCIRPQSKVWKTWSVWEIFTKLEFSEICSSDTMKTLSTHTLDPSW